MNPMEFPEFPKDLNMLDASIEILERLDKAGQIQEILIGKNGEVLVKVKWNPEGYLIFPMRAEPYPEVRP